MARNNCPQQWSPVQQEEHQSSDDSQNARKGNARHRPRCTRAHNQRNSGEEFNINLTDERSTNPSQPNSQTAPPPCPQTNNSSQPTCTPAGLRVAHSRHLRISSTIFGKSLGCRLFVCCASKFLNFILFYFGLTCFYF